MKVTRFRLSCIRFKNALKIHPPHLFSPAPLVFICPTYFHISLSIHTTASDVWYPLVGYNCATELLSLYICFPNMYVTQHVEIFCNNASVPESENATLDLPMTSGVTWTGRCYTESHSQQTFAYGLSTESVKCTSCTQVGVLSQLQSTCSRKFNIISAL